MVPHRTITADRGNLGYEALWVDPVFDIPDDPRAPIILDARSVAMPEGETDLILHSWRVVWVSGVPMGTHPVRIRIRRACFAKRGRTARIRKKDREAVGSERCERLVRAPLPDVVDGHRMTRQLLDHIRIKGVTHSSLEVAREVGVSASVVEREVAPVRKAFIERYVPEAPRWLAIDEVHYRHKKYTVFSDAETGWVIDLLADAQQATVEAALRRLANLDRVEAAACDLYAPYLAALSVVLPHVPVVADRWHIQKLACSAFDEVRSEIFSLPLGKGDHLRRALRQSSALLDTARSKLKKEDKQLLDMLLASEPLLATAYKLTKDFFGLYEIPSRRVAEHYFDQWTSRIPVELQPVFGRFAKTINRNRAAVFRYWDFQRSDPNGTRTTLTTSPAENANKKIKPLLSHGVVAPGLLRQMALLKFGPLTPAEVVRLATAAPCPAITDSARPTAEVGLSKSLDDDPMADVVVSSSDPPLFGDGDLPPEPMLAERLGALQDGVRRRAVDCGSAQLSLLPLLEFGHGCAA